ncbi:MAG TPA: hypothetical protein VF037_09820 [Gemmatimonadales bacterium]
MHACDRSLPSCLDFSLARTSELGLYRIELRPCLPCMSSGPLSRIEVSIAARDGLAVDHAEVEVSGGMPQRGLRLAGSPVVRHRGGGSYRIEDLLLSPPGWWLLRLTVTAAAGVDIVTFNLVL